MATGNSANLYVAVVDDDESLLRSLARLLRAAGMQPITYASAEAFRADMKRPRFDCLVLDVQLPGISGIDLRNQLTAEGAVSPVLFVTAHDDPQARANAMAGPCAGYFRKTDAGSEILDAIRRAVAPATTAT
ncbi:MAG TPA: response regulator [Casimicrobiaceae bacterium]|nr:response regulator [Casimicrobiaceae bacterium]